MGHLDDLVEGIFGSGTYVGVGESVVKSRMTNYKRSASALAHPMQGPRDQFFLCPCRSTDQHSTEMRSDSTRLQSQTPHDGAASYDPELIPFRWRCTERSRRSTDWQGGS